MRRPRHPRGADQRTARAALSLAGHSLLVLAIALAVNALLGPLFVDIIDYPLTETRVALGNGVTVRAVRLTAVRAGVDPVGRQFCLLRRRVPKV